MFGQCDVDHAGVDKFIGADALNRDPMRFKFYFFVCNEFCRADLLPSYTRSHSLNHRSQRFIAIKRLPNFVNTLF